MMIVIAITLRDILYYMHYNYSNIACRFDIKTGINMRMTINHNPHVVYRMTEQWYI